MSAALPCDVARATIEIECSLVSVPSWLGVVMSRVVATSKKQSTRPAACRPFRTRRDDFARCVRAGLFASVVARVRLRVPRDKNLDDQVFNSEIL